MFVFEKGGFQALIIYLCAFCGLLAIVYAGDQMANQRQFTGKKKSQLSKHSAWIVSGILFPFFEDLLVPHKYKEFLVKKQERVNQ